MSFNRHTHPEISAGKLEEFGWHKVQRQTKASLAEIIKRFFDKKSQLYKIIIPEIIETQNDTELTKIHVLRDFPFFERKLPLIAISITGGKERKSYIGADNWSHIVVDYVPVVTSTGTSTGYIGAYDAFYGMRDLKCQIIIAANSPEQRMQLCEFLDICFTHYYRWQYFWYGRDGSMFSLLPSTTEVEFGGESEVNDTSGLNLIYVTTMNISPYVEYTFTDYHPDEKLTLINNFELDDDMDTNLGPINY